jgi:hypothetical protein
MRFKIRIELKEVSDPVVWREIFVPLELTFHDLHKMIQCGMGWTNSHLYTFSEMGKSKYFVINSPYHDEYALDGSKTQANGILLKYLNQFTFGDRPTDKIKYVYDLGDYWEHSIEVLTIDRSSTTIPEIINGEGACPPEDCGGFHGYEDLKMTVRTGRPSEIHGDDYGPWLRSMGFKNFQPDVFDIEKARRKLKRWRSLK